MAEPEFDPYLSHSVAYKYPPPTFSNYGESKKKKKGIERIVNAHVPINQPQQFVNTVLIMADLVSSLLPPLSCFEASTRHILFCQ